MCKELFKIFSFFFLSCKHKYIVSLILTIKLFPGQISHLTNVHAGYNHLLMYSQEFTPLFCED